MLKWCAALSNTAWLVLLAAVALIVIGLDQWTKALAVEQLSYARPVAVSRFFDFTLLYNKGAAFSFLSDAGGWQRWFFTVVSAVASIGISVWIITLKGKERLLAFGLAMVLGGAVGNLIDRVLLSHVVDFLSFHWQEQYYFPAFNLADAAITGGAILLILDMFIHSKRKEAADD